MARAQTRDGRHDRPEPGLEPEAPSKSQAKRELKALHDLGKALCELPERNLARIPLSAEMREAIALARNSTRRALQRQLRFVAKRLREEDVEAIRAALQAVNEPARAQIRAFHKLEQLREALLAGDNEELSDWLRGHPEADRQRLQQLVRNARAEREAGQGANRAYRALFRYLSESSTG